MQAIRTSEPILGYTVTERIGAGGYGEVWKADAPGGLTKAIKFVYGFLDDDRAAREMKALNRVKQVRHPFLLSLERIEIVEGQLVIVTELADMSLKDRCELCKEAGGVGIPRDELLGYLRDAADALDYMRESFSLQHLDVKPENLLLVGGRVKVADFGLVKDIQDTTASLMGGLTPVYAPPEVFDDRPSHHSDQYSLAIVYQEMLTDSLPFPGKTAAQLAAQHTQSKPRLGPLPPADQAVIARALDKSPERRFPSCRAMVDKLFEAGGKNPPPSPFVLPNAPPEADPAADTKSLANSATQPVSSLGLVDAPLPNVDGEPTNEPSSDPTRTECFDRSSARPIAPSAPRGAAPRPSTSRGAWEPKTRGPRPAPTVVDLPPINVAAASQALHPTLIIGIGGTAARTLSRLRQRIHDHLGGFQAVPSLKLLLVDTDSKTLHQATQGEEGAALAHSETLGMPLRRTEDYRAESGQLLQWMSRRWLYNIPRSLQTEGLRPLGRLAFVDHARELFQKLATDLKAITTPEAVAASAASTGREFHAAAPRVFIVSSIAGGTGSGMAVDMAYAVRKVLDELGLAIDRIHGVLLHSTSRKAATRDLAIANTYACLNELYHYSCQDPFPGEAACGLPAAPDHDTTFGEAYLVHLGDDLTEDAFRDGTDAVAEYLYLNATGESAVAFEECRRQSADKQSRSADLMIRTFGVGQLGSSQEVASAQADVLCRNLLDRWRGEEARPRTPSAPRFVVARDVEEALPAPAAGYSDTAVDRQANDHAQSLGLTVDRVVEELYAAVEQELGSDAETYVCQVVERLFAKPPAGAGADKEIETGHILAEINQLLGFVTGDEDYRRPPTASLQTLLDDHLKKIAAKHGETIHEWVMQLADSPDGRMKAAMRACEWYANHLRSLKQTAGEALDRTHQDAAALQEALLDARAKHRAGVFSRLTGGAGFVARFMPYARLRFLEIALNAVRKLAQLVSTQVSTTGDLLKDTRRELNRLADQFVVERTPSASSEEEGPDIVAARVTDSVARRMPELVAELDARFQAEFIVPHGGLCSLAAKPQEVRRELLFALRHEARAAIVQVLGGVSVAGLICDDGTAQEHGDVLRTSLDHASPALLACGGSRRLVLVAPDAEQSQSLRASLEGVAAAAPTVVHDHRGKLVFCYEVEQMSLEAAAATLIEDRYEYAQIASRLHTRADVAWSSLANPSY